MTSGRVPLVRGASGQFVELAKNCQIRGGRWGTRNRIIGYQIDGDHADQWHDTSTQGAIIYHPNAGSGLHYFGVGRDRIVESASGQLWDLNFQGRTVFPCPIGGATGSEHVYLAWLTQAENYVFRTDRLSKTVIQDGKGDAYYSLGYNKNVPESSSTPNYAGPVVYRKDRIWIDVDGRRTFAGDNLHLTHQVSPVDLKNFTDQSYDYTEYWFAQKASHGDNVAYAQVKIGGIEYLVIMGDNLGMSGIRLDQPRENWKDVDMDTVFSDETSASGPYAIAERDSKLLFRSHRGIESLEAVLREQQTIGTAMIRMGAEIQPLLDADHKPYLAFASMVNPPTFDQLFCTVQPRLDIEAGNFRRYHQGWVTADFNPTDTRLPNSWAWEGVSTLPDEMGKVVQFLDGRINRERRVFALTWDPVEKKKGIVELTKDRGDDVLPDGRLRKIPAYLKTKKIIIGSEWNNNTISQVNISFTDVQGQVDYAISVRTSADCEWVTKGCGCGCGKTCVQGECSCGTEDGEFTESLKVTTEEDMNGYKWVQLQIEWWGVADIDFGIEAGSPKGVSDEGTACLSGCERNQIKIFEHKEWPEG